MAETVSGENTRVLLNLDFPCEKTFSRKNQRKKLIISVGNIDRRRQRSVFTIHYQPCHVERSTRFYEVLLGFGVPQLTVCRLSAQS